MLRNNYECNLRTYCRPYMICNLSNYKITKTNNVCIETVRPKDRMKSLDG